MASDGIFIIMVQAKCTAMQNCDGFSWLTDSLDDPEKEGEGCLKKNCQNTGSNGYGQGGFSYLEKVVSPCPPLPPPSPPSPPPGHAATFDDLLIALDSDVPVITVEGTHRFLKRLHISRNVTITSAEGSEAVFDGLYDSSTLFFSGKIGVHLTRVRITRARVRFGSNVKVKHA